MTEPYAIAVERLVEAIRPLLAGKAPPVQGAALADLLAVWLAGHMVPGEPAETQLLRDELLDAHISIVRKLIPVNERPP